MTAEKDPENAGAPNAGGNIVTGGNNKDNKVNAR